MLECILINIEVSNKQPNDYNIKPIIPDPGNEANKRSLILLP